MNWALRIITNVYTGENVRSINGLVSIELVPRASLFMVIEK